MGSESDKFYLLEKIFDNNYELYKMVKKQVILLESYQKDFKEEITREGELELSIKIKECNEMLELIGLTSDTIGDEWDSETDRKS